MYVADGDGEGGGWWDAVVVSDKASSSQHALLNDHDSSPQGLSGQTQWERYGIQWVGEKALPGQGDGDDDVVEGTCVCVLLSNKGDPCSGIVALVCTHQGLCAFLSWLWFHVSICVCVCVCSFGMAVPLGARTARRGCMGARVPRSGASALRRRQAPRPARRALRAPGRRAIPGGLQPV